MDEKVKKIEEILGESIEQLLDCCQLTAYEQRLHLAVTLLLSPISTLEAKVKEKELEERWRRYTNADPKCRDIAYMISVEQANERLEKRIKELEDGIRKHKINSMSNEKSESWLAEVDKELYTLVEK